jgi:hypothetical protein
VTKKKVENIELRQNVFFIADTAVWKARVFVIDNFLSQSKACKEWVRLT